MDIKFFLFVIVRLYLFIFEREEGREKERERNIDVREKHQSVASRMCPDQGGTEARALTRNLEVDLHLRGDAQPTEPHESGLSFLFRKRPGFSFPHELVKMTLLVSAVSKQFKIWNSWF